MGDKAKPETTAAIPGYLNFLIGGISGMGAIVLVQPFDLIKTRMQLLGPEAKNVSMISVIRGIAAKEGITALYTGLSAALLRQATYSTGRLGCFNTAQDMYKNAYGTPPVFGTKIVMGMASGAVGAVIGNPAEVALIRMTADGRLPVEQRRNYRHVFNALSRITREEGVTTLWRGTTVTVTRAVVVNGAELGTYAQAREVLLPHLSDGIFLHFCASMIAGLASTVASLPADIVKTRVQNAEKGASKSQLTVLTHVIKTEGFFALWSGFVPTYGKLGPHAVFCFIFMEQLNALYLRTIAKNSKKNDHKT